MAWQAGYLVVKLHSPAGLETTPRAALLQGEHYWQDLPGAVGDMAPTQHQATPAYYSRRRCTK
jgi:hypothetical protein